MTDKKFKEKAFILNSEIIDFYKDYCNDLNIPFSMKKAKKFIDFLSVDIYDWFRSNFRYFK
ncbi:MAG: hypothetical protein JXB50_02855 [Spirochaetes bacterium]|nr:hypothetical protein [Spirochaetota bacterium]